jgi:hypothetical protein
MYVEGMYYEKQILDYIIYEEQVALNEIYEDFFIYFYVVFAAIISLIGIIFQFKQLKMRQFEDSILTEKKFLNE